jgi:hypothetical protein
MAKKEFTRVFSVRLTEDEWKILMELVDGVDGGSLSDRFRLWLRKNGSCKVKDEGKHEKTPANNVDASQKAKEPKNFEQTDLEALKDRTRELLRFLEGFRV